MSLNSVWGQGSRRTGGAPSDVPFAPKKWPLTPKAKVPKKDPTDAVDATNPAKDRSSSGGETSGTHGTGRGANGRDTGVPSDDITVSRGNRTPHHCDDDSEPERSDKRDTGRGVRGIRSRRRRRAGMAAQDQDQDQDVTPVRPAPTAQVHTAAGVRMDSFAADQAGASGNPNFPGTKPLRYITPSKRPRAGLGSSRSRTLPGPAPQTSPLPCPGCQNNNA